LSVSPKGVKHPPWWWQIDFAPWLKLKILKLMNEGKYEFLTIRREFRHPFITGKGTFNHVERILIKTDFNGQIGFGEVAPWPGFETETISQCLDLLKSASGNLKHLTDLLNKMESGYPCLRAALSACRWWPKIINLNNKTSCAGLISQPLKNSLKEKLATGFKTVKIKINPTTRLSEIKELILSAPSEIIFRLDANGCLNLDQTNQWITLADALNQIEFIEQPLPVNHPFYNQITSEKVALDESFISPNKISWRGTIIVKPALVGDWETFLEWRKTHRGKLVYSSVFETAFGRQSALWLAQQDSSASAIGFDTLNYFKPDNLDHHSSGAWAEGLYHFDWLDLWKKLS
jgi:O-succinylbenzoate synthase